MTAILGIDAASTTAEPSGVALIAKHGNGWRCVALAPSYDTFIELTHGVPDNFVCDHENPRLE